MGQKPSHAFVVATGTCQRNVAMLSHGWYECHEVACVIGAMFHFSCPIAWLMAFLRMELHRPGAK
eukprot:2048557-Lingulodinium_polyedra.AAC.1